MTETSQFAIPTGLGKAFYADMLESLIPYGAELGLVETDPASATLGPLLAAHEISSALMQSWPATVSATAHQVHTYRFNSSLLTDLFTISTSGWGTDPFPLDLYVLRADRSALITTISSHHRSWLQLTPREQVMWDLDNPRLSTIIREQAPPRGEVVALYGLVGTKMGEELNPDILRGLRDSLGPPLRDEVEAYLREGSLVLPQGGTSRDVVEGQFVVEGGADLLSDGRFCWRRDAAWYVARYGTMIPIAALKHFESNGWAAPALSEEQIEDIDDFIWNDL